MHSSLEAGGAEVASDLTSFLLDLRGCLSRIEVDAIGRKAHKQHDIGATRLGECGKGHAHPAIETV